jgi:UDP:flavonoid glycosyltransferase YjiC (YdhE family)
VTQPDRPLRWAFFTYAHNYGDCSRAVEVAKAMRAAGHTVAFFHRGGHFASAIADAGFEPIALHPQISLEQHERLMAIDQHRAPVGTPLPFAEGELVAMVDSELAAFRDFRADGVYCGLNLSSMISAPAARLPTVTLVPAALCPAFFERGMASFPDAMNRRAWLRWLVPAGFKRALINRIMLGDSARASATIFNRVRARHGLAPIFNYTALVRGDLTLLPDLPELSGLPAEALPPGYRYCGPIFARLDLPVPDAVTQVFANPGLKVFCAMGSSGSAELLKIVVAALRASPDYNVVCATTSIAAPEELGASSQRFFATRLLPAPRISELADVVVSHGGQGTVQTAMWAGTPVVGIGFQWEQQANLDAIAGAGAGLRIPIYSVTPARVRAAVETARTPAYARCARGLRETIRASDGAAYAAELMNAFLCERLTAGTIAGSSRSPHGPTTVSA